MTCALIHSRTSCVIFTYTQWYLSTQFPSIVKICKKKKKKDLRQEHKCILNNNNINDNM